MTRPLRNWHPAHAEHLTRGERAELMEIDRMPLTLLPGLRTDPASQVALERGKSL
ncbi:hypothetical protein [Microbacterium saperdae]|uniref:hypothetical protein n=1 Tax=Microbacterium saperdae TaxID=69368 RepID=UPI001E34F82D|nr:hypothetical protein [Microbacterium saperdae]